MIYFEGLVGSRLYGSNVGNSDTDVVVVANEPENIERRPGKDIHWFSPEEYISTIFEKEPGNYNQFCLFSKPMIETDFSKYLMENREELMRSNLRRFGGINYRYAQGMSHQGKNQLNRKFYKRTILALRALNEYIRYATENISYAEAMKQPEEQIALVKGLKGGTVSYEEQMAYLRKQLARAEECKPFYDREPDVATFDRIKGEMTALLGLLYYKE